MPDTIPDQTSDTTAQSLLVQGTTAPATTRAARNHASAIHRRTRVAITAAAYVAHTYDDEAIN